MISDFNLYWGDIHNHCGISYGIGTLESAFARAREQLDFCSVTGHGLEPEEDWEEEGSRYHEINLLHRDGARRLKGNWSKVQRVFERTNVPGRFVTILGYEWHSRKYGDHCVYYPDYRGALRNANGIDELQRQVAQAKGILVPHHIAYPKGYRGIDWERFDERISPVVEIYSMHGCSESSTAPYPMLHRMGPRDYYGTAEHGLATGRKFGFVASSDEHTGYPGSWGSGRMAVLARTLSSESLWEAIRSRRTYAVTGDKIKVDLLVNGAPIGSELAGSRREITYQVETCHFLQSIELVKNSRVLYRRTPDLRTAAREEEIAAKIRIEWGWGSGEELVHWELKATASAGEILSVEPCFGSALSMLDIWSPHFRQADVELPSRVLDRTDNSCAWYSHTFGNVTQKHCNTQSLVLEVRMPRSGRLTLDVNNNRYEHKLEDLLRGCHVHLPRGIQMEAIRIHRAVPMEQYRFTDTIIDEAPESETDYYYLRVSQLNDQWAWVTPIWVSS